jgi:hypothetical protein
MSQIDTPINAVRSTADQAAHHALHSRAVAAGINKFAQGKVDTSAVPTNLVEATWQDALDMVNPLQQIPVVGDIYRHVTGEKISGIARVAGGFLWGGVTGGFIAAATAAYAEANNDHSPGEQMVAALLGSDEPETPEATMLAEATAAPPQPVTAPAAKTTETMTTPATTSTAAPAAVIAAAPVTPSTAPTLTAVAPKLQADTPVFTASLPLSPPVERGQHPTASTTGELTVQAAQVAPLRERLNHKNPGSITAVAKPLEQFSPSWATPTSGGIAGIGGTKFQGQPSSAASQTTGGLTAAQQQQNLQLLQGYIDPMTSADATHQTAVIPLPTPFDPTITEPVLSATSAPATPAATSTVQNGTLQNPITASGHNPLPLQLVQDMMLQALDKYKAMKSATPDGLAAQ